MRTIAIVALALVACSTRPTTPPAPPPTYTPALRSGACIECTFIGRCIPVPAYGEASHPCCEPITRVGEDYDPTGAAQCAAAAVHREHSCKTCVGRTANGSACYRREAHGNADMRPCCEPRTPDPFDQICPE